MRRPALPVVPSVALAPLVVAIALTLPGCAAARAGYYIVNANQKYQAALSQGADDHAPYETTLAGAYLDKAREEDGYNDFGVTEQLCKRSIEMSTKALTKSEDLSPVQNPDKFVPEERKKEPVKAAEPAPDLNIDLEGN